MVQISWTIQAKNDLKAVFDYIKLDSIRYAKFQVIKIKSITQVLKTFPLSGRIVPELEDEKIRELLEGNYRIIYKVLSEDRIDILTIHHSSRDLAARTIR